MEAIKVYGSENVSTTTLSTRIAHIIQSSFAGKRIVVFSGGAAKGLDGLYDEIRAIRDGGGFGSIIGRNSFQRGKEDAHKFLDTVMGIYEGSVQ